MREVPENSNLHHSLQPRVVADGKETGSSASRNSHRQEEQIQFPAAHGADRLESKMPMPLRAPVWHRHWGLNE